MRSATPFFKCFGPLLFGKPPVSSFKKAMAQLPQINSLAQLRQLFGSYIPSALLASKASGPNSRTRIFSQEVTFWAFVCQVQTPGGSCREVVRKVVAYFRRMNPKAQIGAMSGDTSAYCQARARLPLEVISDINEHLVERLQRNLPSAGLWRGRHVKLVDGTGVSMPDTQANQQAWPQISSQKPGCGFPSMNLVGLFCLLTGALIKVATGDRHTHERTLFQSLWHTLEKGDLIVADRGYCSFGAFANLLLRGVDALMRLPEKNIRQAIGSKLPKTEDFDVIVTWNRPAQRIPSMTTEDFALLPESIPVRVIRYTIAASGFRTKSVTLVTTLLEADIEAADLAELYFRRWGIEIHFREIKILLNMDVLRCLTPDMIERELRMHFVAYNLIRCVMQKAALTHDADINRLSFKGCLDTVRQFANAAYGAEDKPRTLAALIDEMLLAIAKDTNPLRPGRTEPRAVKRRPKNFHLLTKPRREMGNLPHRNKGVSKNPKTPLT